MRVFKNNKTNLWEIYTQNAEEELFLNGLINDEIDLTTLKQVKNDYNTKRKIKNNN